MNPSPSTCAYSTPRISLVDLQTAVRAVSSMLVVVCTAAPACRRGVPGWVYWVGTTPSPPTQYPPTRLLVLPGPNRCLKPAIWTSAGTPGLPEALRTPAPRYSPPRPNRARFSLKYTKVSHNPRVSSKSVHEACHTPCFRKRPECHDLEFLRFPY